MRRERGHAIYIYINSVDAGEPAAQLSGSVVEWGGETPELSGWGDAEGSNGERIAAGWALFHGVELDDDLTSGTSLPIAFGLGFSLFSFL